MEWAQETIARLRSLWDEGHSTAEVGRRLGVSKNSVVGKAHRLDLPKRPSPIRKEPTEGSRLHRRRSTPMPAGSVTLPKLACLDTPEPRLPSPPRIKAPRPVRPRRFIEHTAAVVELREKPRVYCRDCQWVESLRVGRTPPIFCDQPAVRGSYCAPHAELVYVRPADRREDEFKIAA
jgi:GcrA cell cycle regulator